MGRVGVAGGANHVAGLGAAGGVQELEWRQKGPVRLAGEGRRQVVRRGAAQAGRQHLPEIVVNLRLVVDDQDTVVVVFSGFHEFVLISFHSRDLGQGAPKGRCNRRLFGLQDSAQRGSWAG